MLCSARIGKLVSFHPQMNIMPIGVKKNGNTIYLYYQICPECGEAVVGLK